jgi:ferric-dicitrate binding protein FerR (iron transport regulator)
MQKPQKQFPMNIISKLIDQYLKHRHTPELEAKVQRWLVGSEHAGEKDDALHEYWNGIPARDAAASRKAFVTVKRRIGMDEHRAKVVPMRRKWLRVAAVLLPLLLAGAGYWYVGRPVPIAEVAVPNGERRQITLPDGSQAWVNAGSTLTYPERFPETRTIQLTGEAYFAVTKDPQKPFIVQTKHISVQALGTEFCVTGYPDEDQTVATLVTGTIRVKTKNEREYLMKRRQRLSYHHATRRSTIVDVPADDAAAWRNGHLVFSDASLEEILRAMERHYGVTVRRENVKPSGDRYTIRFVRGETFDEAITVLEDVVGYPIGKRSGKLK